jgi:serine protease AprX
MTLVVLVLVSPATAGLRISMSDGIVMTGVDGIVMTGVDGIVMTGVDQFFNTHANGIVMTGVDGADNTTSDGIVMTGVDSVSHPYTARFNSADGVSMNGADGIVMTGVDGIVMTGVDGTTYYADAVYVTLPDGIVMTGVDGIVMTGVDGAQREAGDGIVMTGVDSTIMTTADGVTLAGADAVRAVGADGAIYSVAPEGLRFTDVEGIVMTGVDGIVMTGVDGIVMTGVDGLLPDALRPVTDGLQSVDPELVAALSVASDDSSINAVVVYHQLPTDADLADLQKIGIVGGTRFRVLPAVTVTGTPDQIKAIWDLPAVRSVYGNRTLNLNSEPEVRAITGVNRAWKDAEITSVNRGLPVSGKNVTVAIIDTGIDSTHSDLSGRVTKNVKLAGTQSANVGFNYPVSSDHLSNTDQLYGHGTFVAGVIAGGGNSSGGKFAGVAPNARLVGLSAGDLNLFYVLEGFDYLLTNGNSLGVRVVNCSFSTNALFDTNDPVNVATKMLTDAGVNVVFSAGNNGPGQHTLNPYAAAPWVVSVGATDTQGRLAKFSARGGFADPLFHPTLVAPGVNVVSLRGSGVANVTGAAGLINVDSTRLSHFELPYYTTANGTSFSAPQVAGAIALMLETNPSLTPAQVKDILQRTATPLPPYYTFETGTGMLNVHAAVLEAAIPDRRIGTWRGALDRNQVEFASEAPKTFSGTVMPGKSTEISINIPAGALSASVQISWGPLWSNNDLGLSVYDQIGALRGESNTLNLTGLNGKREGVNLIAPSAGTWKVSVRNSFGGVSTPQKFYGVVQIGRASYSGMNDVSALSPSLREDIYQSIRSFTMWPIGSKFRADHAVTRSDLASAMIIGGRVPQYLPAQSSYRDVSQPNIMLFVESAQSSPTGALFVDVTKGGQFRPNDNATRLTAAVALVRSAGLRADAESHAGPLPYLDAASIPTALRGYVAVAVSKGLIETGSSFKPSDAFTRGDLARAVATIQRRAVLE